MKIQKVTFHSILFVLPLSLCASPLVQSQLQGDDPILVVHSIRVVGNESTKEFVVLREMTTSLGDTLNLETLEYDKGRIYSLGLFNRVEIDYSASGNQADLTVRVHERWYIYPFPVLGFRYRDLKKLYYGAGLAHSNFRGRNERLVTEFAFGYDRWAQLIYQNPKLTDDDDIFLRVSAGWWRIENLNPERGTYRQETYNGSLSLGKRFGISNLAVATISYESWFVPDVGFGRTISVDGRDRFLSTGLGYTFDSRNLKEYATEGFFVNASITKSGFGSSSVNTLRYGYDVRSYVPVTDEVSIAGRTHAQFTSGGPVPPYHYTYFGHKERIRGYFSSIIEGESIVGGNLEVRFPILSPRYYEFPYAPLPEFSVWRIGLYGGVFADAGKTWFRSEGFSGRSWYSGAGAGLHFLFPYSVVIRTEYAINRSGKGEFVVDFGASF